MLVNLCVERMRSGARIVRPQHAIGTCGWHPKAWQAVYLKGSQNPVDAFLEQNRLWEFYHIGGIVYE